MSPARSARAACIMVAMLLAGGCTNLPRTQGDKDLLAAVVPGTSREAMLLKMGTPSASFEGGRIITYRIGEIVEGDSPGYFIIDRRVWEGDGKRFSLVLVFDEKGNLVKHSLVPVR